LVPVKKWFSHVALSSLLAGSPLHHTPGGKSTIWGTSLQIGSAGGGGEGGGGLASSEGAVASPAAHLIAAPL